jgi:hypothetical protein
MYSYITARARGASPRGTLVHRRRGKSATLAAPARKRILMRAKDELRKQLGKA